MRNFRNIFGLEFQRNIFFFNSHKELKENGEWSIYTIGSIIWEILVYKYLYKEYIYIYINNYIGNYIRRYRQNDSTVLARIAIPDISYFPSIMVNISFLNINIFFIIK